MSTSSRADALVLFNPRLDTVNERGIELFGSLERARRVSPVHHVKTGNPPTLIMHGKEDSRLDVDHVLRFQEAMKAAGNRCDVHLYDNAPHGFFNHEPWFSETLKETDRFLVSLGYLEGAEQVDAFPYEGILRQLNPGSG